MQNSLVSGELREVKAKYIQKDRLLVEKRKGEKATSIMHKKKMVISLSLQQLKMLV